MADNELDVQRQPMSGPPRAPTDTADIAGSQVRPGGLAGAQALSPVARHESV